MASSPEILPSGLPPFPDRRRTRKPEEGVRAVFACTATRHFALAVVARPQGALTPAGGGLVDGLRRILGEHGDDVALPGPGSGVAR